MTGKFTEKDTQRCAHYARFMKHLSLTQANTIFWTLFVLTLALMCVSSIQHHKSIRINDLEKNLPAEEVASPKYRRKVVDQRRFYLGVAGFCFLLAIVCVVMECFALFNIQYCDGEDLTQLYWGFWSILQVGSLIAIFGVMVQFWIVLQNVETPSWAVALGTPVLVFAALGWVFKHTFTNNWKRWRGKEIVDSDDSSGEETDREGNTSDEEKVGRWVSRAPTLVPGNTNPDNDNPEASNDSKREGLKRTLTL
ncbi:hypothetical protein BGZ60DRAFT_433325 [Tricladium varicosporioides]|nr:hypothetical protein BGZ60DRAFT_433325 [Hymenoscyphus varicosporioides]